jgi:HPt (histidine-containing phosphotransfer) domain-containing protein
MSQDELALEEFYSERDFDLFLEEDLASEGAQSGFIHTVASWLGFPALKNFEKLIESLKEEINETESKTELSRLLERVSKEQDYAERASKETSGDRVKRAVWYFLLMPLPLIATGVGIGINVNIRDSQRKLKKAADELEILEKLLEAKLKKAKD